MSDMPGFPTDSPASVSPLTLRMLLRYLQNHVDAGDVDPDSLVYVAAQPNYPYAYPITDLVADAPLPDEEWPGCVYLAAGRSAGRLDPEIQRELGWAAEPPRGSDPADPSTYGYQHNNPTEKPTPPPALPAKTRKRT